MWKIYFTCWKKNQIIREAFQAGFQLHQKSIGIQSSQLIWPFLHFSFLAGSFSLLFSPLAVNASRQVCSIQDAKTSQRPLRSHDTHRRWCQRIWAASGRVRWRNNLSRGLHEQTAIYPHKEGKVGAACPCFHKGAPDLRLRVAPATV